MGLLPSGFRLCLGCLLLHKPNALSHANGYNGMVMTLRESGKIGMRRKLVTLTPAPTLSVIPTSSPPTYLPTVQEQYVPTTYPTTEPPSSLGLLVMWICIMFIFVSIGITIYRCMITELSQQTDEDRRQEDLRRRAQESGLQVDGEVAAKKFISKIPVISYCDSVAYRTSQIAKMEKVPTRTDAAGNGIGLEKAGSGVYDGPLSPAARLRAAASQGDDVDDVAVGMGEEEEVCSICIMEFEAHDKVKELNCLHVFHEECLDQWLLRSMLCPLCKRKAIGRLSGKPLKKIDPKNSVNRTLSFDGSLEMSVLYGEGTESWANQEGSMTETPNTQQSRLLSTPGSAFPTLFSPNRWSIFTPRSDQRQTHTQEPNLGQSTSEEQNMEEAIQQSQEQSEQITSGVNQTEGGHEQNTNVTRESLEPIVDETVQTEEQPEQTLPVNGASESNLWTVLGQLDNDPQPLARVLSLDEPDTPPHNGATSPSNVSRVTSDAVIPAPAPAQNSERSSSNSSRISSNNTRTARPRTTRGRQTSAMNPSNVNTFNRRTNPPPPRSSARLHADSSNLSTYPRNEDSDARSIGGASQRSASSTRNASRNVSRSSSRRLPTRGPAPRTRT